MTYFTCRTCPLDADIRMAVGMFDIPQPAMTLISFETSNSLLNFSIP